MARRKKTEESKQPKENRVDGEADIPKHRHIRKTHLTEEQTAEKPGGDGMGLQAEGTAHATSVVGGAMGQRVGLPAPLAPEEANEKGWLSDEDKEALANAEAESKEKSEEKTE